jgi:hypothetical protein
MVELMKRYSSASTTELRRRHELSQGSVIKILHEHGVVMRGQGLGDGDVSTAAELYRAGATLAQLGQGPVSLRMQFGGHWFRQAWRCGRAA